MRQIRVITVGKRQSDDLQVGIDNYLGRIKHFADIELVYLKHQSGNLKKRQKQETAAILEKLNAQEICCILDAHAPQKTSEQFASWIQDQFSTHSLCFVIGGAYGLDLTMLQHHQHLSLSSMTFTHQMTRLILVEQIYRAFQIIEGTPYHHSN